jgi:hypothetical protein
MIPKTIAIDDPELLAQAEKVARDAGLSIEQLATEGLRREIGRRSLAKLKREAAARRGTITDQEIDETVARAVSEYRAEQHNR